MNETPRNPLSFPHAWRAEILAVPPLVAPARQFIYPRAVPGEEDALARGALQLLVHPEFGGGFLATCALGFTDPSMPSGVWSCPNPQQLCAVAGGYAYIIDTAEPERSTHIPLRPVVELVSVPPETFSASADPAAEQTAKGLLLFAGFHSILAWGSEELAWHTARLSWEGLRITGVIPAPGGTPTLHGFGWNLHTDKEAEFAIDLRTGTHTGGAY